MNYNELADLLFPDAKYTVAELEEKYPVRNLPKGGIVTRFAPSPTGYLHIGSIFTCLVASRFAHTTGGKFLLRLEDTDQSREIPGAISMICEDLNKFNIFFDEGRDEEGNDYGDYGPYRQSERKDIYIAVAKKLVAEGKAYPCFCTKEITESDRKMQEMNKDISGYYGKYARCRNLSMEEVKENLAAGKPFAIRLRVEADLNKLIIKDAIRGEFKLTKNANDVVILKSDFLPPYNFAHVCDDHFMRVNLVMRGDEYIPSISEHIQIFDACGFDRIEYAHVAPIEKQEGNTRRKISKRKDPEAKVSFYDEMGYPYASVTEYLLTIANSNFEDWRRANPEKDDKEFNITLNKMSSSGALFDEVKLNDVSKNVIATFKAAELYDMIVSWSSVYDKNLNEIITKYADYTKAMLNIEREVKKPRKDIACFSQIAEEYSYFYDELAGDFDYDFGEFDKEDVKVLLDRYVESYDEKDEKEGWFNKIKFLGEDIGFASDMKEYKANKEGFKGSYGDTASIIRMAVTGRKNTPDLYEICKLLKIERIKERLSKIS